MASGNFSLCCRLCLGDRKLKNIFGNFPTDTSLPQKISSNLGVKMTTSDKISTLVCTLCIEKVNSWQSFRILCIENQFKLEQWLKGNVCRDLSIQIKEEMLYNEAELVEELPPPLSPQQLDKSDYKSPPDLSNELHFEANEKKDLNALRSQHKCPICDRLYSTKTNMMRHYKTHSQSERTLHESRNNGGGSNEARSLHEEHQKGHNVTGSLSQSSSPYTPIEGPHKCPICHKEYAHKTNLYRHAGKEHPGVKLPVKSFYKMCCNREFRRAGPYVRHMQTHGKSERNKRTYKQWAEMEQSDDDSYFTCKRCFKVFDSRSYWRKHMRSHGITISQKRRSKTPKKMNGYNSSDEDDDAMPVLTMADAPSLKKQEEKAASANVEVSKEQSSKIVCKKCKITFENESILIKHMQNEHTIEMPSMMMRKQIDEEQHEFKCIMCTKSFTSKRGLNLHNAWHRKPYNRNKQILFERLDPFNKTCLKCNKMFTNQDELDEHTKWHLNAIEQKTKDGANYCCTDCPAAYSDAESLNYHVKQVHRVEKYSCLQCDRIFDKQISLQVHLKVHDKPKVISGKKAVVLATRMPLPIFFCSICKQGFNVPKDLRMHTIKEHPFVGMGPNYST